MIHLLEDVEDMIQLVIRCGKFERCLRNDAKQYRYRENIDALKITAYHKVAYSMKYTRIIKTIQVYQLSFRT